MAKKQRPTFSAPPTDRPKPAADWVYRSEGRAAAPPAPPAPSAAPKAKKAAAPRRTSAGPVPAALAPAPATERASVNLASMVLMPLAIVDGLIVQPIFSLCRGSR